MTWQTLEMLTQWLATPDGSNTAFLVLSGLGALGLNGRILALLALAFHLILVVA